MKTILFIILTIGINNYAYTQENEKSKFQAEVGLNVGYANSSFQFTGTVGRLPGVTIDSFDPSNNLFVELTTTIPVYNNILFDFKVAIVNAEYQLNEDADVISFGEGFSNRSTMIYLGTSYNFNIGNKFFIRPMAGFTARFASSFKGAGVFRGTGDDGIVRNATFFPISGQADNATLQYSFGLNTLVPLKKSLNLRVSSNYVFGGQLEFTDSIFSQQVDQSFFMASVGLVVNFKPRIVSGRTRPEFVES